MRGLPVCLRKLTAEERSAIETLARSRTAPARRVERARIVWRASRGETPPAIAAALGLDAETVRRRPRRAERPSWWSSVVPRLTCSKDGEEASPAGDDGDLLGPPAGGELSVVGPEDGVPSDG